MVPAMICSLEGKQCKDSLLLINCANRPVIKAELQGLTSPEEVQFFK